MKHVNKSVIIFMASLIATLTASLICDCAIAKTKNDSNKKITQAMVAHNLFDQVEKNNHWKFAFASGKNEQVVFMSVSPQTNPNNEIGMETHDFDQVILIVSGNGKTILDGVTSMVKAGDMIFIPQGTAHNVINLNQHKDLKILSFYSENDIPPNAVLSKKSDEQE